MNTTSHSTPDVLPMPAATATERRRLTIGLPSGAACGERRFPLTPEGAAQLVERGLEVVMEQGAGAPIHYPDADYSRVGVRIATRGETLRCNVIISLAPLCAREIAGMRRGAMLLTLAPAVTAHGSAKSAAALLAGGIMTVAMERIEDSNGNRRVADILHEIDGCASLSIASAMLTDPVHGKGILLGGVTGIVPCEVTVLGSGMGAIAAAHCALGMGATVRLFDNDLYSLRQAGRVLDHRVIASAMHPNVLHSALRSADVVIVTPSTEPHTPLGPEAVALMKRRVLVFDLTSRPGHTFPGLPLFDLGDAGRRELAAGTERACYFNVGCQVPRTAAMALSNVLVSLSATLLDVSASQLSEQSLLLTPGTRAALLTVYGKAVDSEVATLAGVRPVDPNLFTSLS